MTRFVKVFFIATLAVLCACSPFTVGIASTAYPEKPVEVVVAFAPGGGTDAAARLVFKYAQKYFPQNFAIINKPGAAGEIGFTSIAQSKADGYTIGFINPPTILLHPIQREGCRYTLDDFEPIANIVMDPGVIAVKKDSKYTTLKELFDAAKAKKKAVSIGYSGPGTSEAMTLKKLERMNEMELNKIPFEGSAPSVVALLGGHVDAVCMNISEAYTQVEEGNIKLLGVGSTIRDATLKDVPTYKEQGFDLIQVALRGVAAPKGIPAEAKAKIEQAIAMTMQDPEFVQKTKEMQMPLHYMGSEEYTQFLNSMNNDLQNEWTNSPW
ncbi:hypothetical protein SDC9_116483 [bioreactor metagenome]|uniref:Tripartite tricarboxylate transporter family receptor n=1 Tax=bioreactor metagenome TaxID=1076179 RepID=A0A645BWQ3_9ZZZZ|nr:tripartite tricarboxylate transporter substrate-binding protein [Aminobacterium sp.]MEA4877891.1 tripartite tricarboxylate transporter substrate binding protein [Aminobacterium sp.]